MIIHDYANGLAGVRCSNPELRLSVTRDSTLADETVLVVEYPAATGQPAERDVWCDVQHHDWSSGRGLLMQVKPDQATRLSVSFMATNGVAYTAWLDLVARKWQPVEILFAQIRPNPYFQPPGANKDTPIDVSDVKRLGFAPQVKESGRMAVSRVVLVT